MKQKKEIQHIVENASPAAFFEAWASVQQQQQQAKQHTQDRSQIKGELLDFSTALSTILKPDKPIPSNSLLLITIREKILPLVLERQNLLSKNVRNTLWCTINEMGSEGAHVGALTLGFVILRDCERFRKKLHCHHHEEEITFPPPPPPTATKEEKAAAELQRQEIFKSAQVKRSKECCTCGCGCFERATKEYFLEYLQEIELGELLDIQFTELWIQVQKWPKIGYGAGMKQILQGNTKTVNKT